MPVRGLTQLQCRIHCGKCILYPSHDSLSLVPCAWLGCGRVLCVYCRMWKHISNGPIFLYICTSLSAGDQESHAERENDVHVLNSESVTTHSVVYMSLAIQYRDGLHTHDDARLPAAPKPGMGLCWLGMMPGCCPHAPTIAQACHSMGLRIMTHEFSLSVTIPCTLARHHVDAVRATMW
jgi:hypothetical protein